MPHGFFSRLIVRLHEKIEGEERWENGVRLVDSFKGQKVRAEIQQVKDTDENQEVIDIRINGGKEACKELLTFIRSSIDNLHKDFKNIQFKREAVCNCNNCISLVEKGSKPSFYDYEKLLAKIENRKYEEECGKSNYELVNIGQILNDVIIENAAVNNKDIEFLEMLKSHGLNITQIMNINKNENNNNAASSSTSNAEAKAEATSTVTIEINNFLGEIQDLKNNIWAERKILSKNIDDDYIDVVLKKIENAESVTEELDQAVKENKEPSPKAKTGIKNFIENILDEKSIVFKTLKFIENGSKYTKRLIENYNKIAKDLGLPDTAILAANIIQ